MDHAAAGFWLDAIAAGAAAAWVAGLLFVRRTTARMAAPLTGSLELTGTCKQLAPRLAAALVRGIAGSGLHGLSIQQRTDHVVTWSCTMAPARHRGEVRLADLGAGRTRATWTLTLDPRQLRAARWVVAAGAVWVSALYLVLRYLVLDHADPGVRGQAVQMVQAVHLLWPPFLLAGLARSLRTRLAAAVATLVGNLPHEAAS